MPNPMLQPALAWLHAGFPICPIDMRPDPKREGKPRKRPTRKWKQWQSNPMSDDSARRIYTTGVEDGLSLLGGSHNTLNLCALDVEAGPIADAIRLAFSGKTILVNSGTGGVHIWVRSRERVLGGALVPGIADLQATGQLLIIPPTPGYSYEGEVPDPAAFLIMEVPNAREWALEVLRQHGVEASLIEKADWRAFQGPELVAEGRNQSLASLAGKLSEKLALHPVHIEAALRGLYDHGHGGITQEGFDPDEEIPKMARQAYRWEQEYKSGEYTLLEPGRPAPVVPEWLIDEFLYPHYVTILYGYGGHGKTYLAQWIALCLLTGHPFLGRKTKKVSNVLWLNWETDLLGFELYTYPLCKGVGLDAWPENRLHHWRAKAPLSMCKDEVERLVQTTGASIVILDSAMRALGVDPVEERTAVTQLMDFLDLLGPPVVLIDHQAGVTGKDDSYTSKQPYGFRGKVFMARNMWQVQRLEVGSGPTTMGGVVRREKNNLGLPNGEAWPFRIEGIREKETRIVSAVSTRAGLIGDLEMALRQQARPMTAEELAADCDNADLNTVQKRIADLRRKGRIKAVVEPAFNRPGQYEAVIE